MDVSTINEDCVEHIVSYLSIQNILQCSRVNIAWRQAFNKDRFWKGKCVKHGLIDTIHHLRKTPSQVKPKFVVPKTTSKRLDHVCEWRVNYMRVQHLMRNWINGNFEVCQRLLDFERMDAVDLQDNLLFTYQYNSCTVLNVVGEPFVVTSFEMAFDTRIQGPLTFKNGRVVVIQMNLLQVYKLSGIRFVLDYRRILNESEVSVVESPGKLSLKGWKFRLFFHHKIVDDILVSLEEEDKGVEHNPSYYIFHIWNLDTGKKLSEFKWETKFNGHILDIHFSKLSNTEIMVALTYLKEFPNSGSKYDTNIYTYSFNMPTLKLHSQWGEIRLVAMPKNGVLFERRKNDGCLRARNFENGEILASLHVGSEHFNSFNLCPAIIIQEDAFYKLISNKNVFPLSAKKNGGEDSGCRYKLELRRLDKLTKELPIYNRWTVNCIEEHMTKMVLKNWTQIKIMYFW